MGLNILTLGASKKYTEQTIVGEGAVKGKDGADGKSAYQIAKENGFAGTEQEWLESINGTNGEDGKDGYSPIITENVNNTENIYKLDIKTKDNSFTTPNLIGQGVDSGTGDENTIESISVNGTALTPSENKNVDITIPEVPIKTISQDGTALAIDENGNVDIPIADTNKIEVVKVNGVELEISDTDKSVDITVPDEYDDAALSDRVTETENAIATLNGTGEGSVSKTVDDALNKFATDLSDDGVVNTYKELVDYAANHSSDVAEMVADIEANTTAIEELNTKIADIEIPSLDGYAKTEDIPTVTNDLTDELKEKYDKAEENVQSDWEETDETSDAFIKNKPTIPSTDGLATETFVTDKIAEAQLGGEEVDLSSYVKTETLTDELAKYSTTEVSDEKYVLDEEIEVLDVTAIESMIGLNSDEILGLASLLSDQEISISHTWSSSKIYSELANTLDESKAYTLSELSKAIGASYKVVTSVDQMTDSKVLYLLKDADSGMYNIYVYDADTSTAELIGSFEINLDDYLKISDAESQYVKQTDLVANYATKQEVVDGYATKTELQDAIADIEVEISTDENNQLENRENGLFVGSETITISKADYDALSDTEKNNGKTYFVPDDETTEDGTDLTQFAKVSDLEETNSKIEEINDSLAKSIITFTPNSEYVVTNYTYCRKSGNIVILNVDMTYNVDTQYTEYVMGTIDSDFPESTVFNVILNGDGGKIQLYVRPSGEVMIETGDSTVGINSRVRYQLMWIV